MNAKKIPNFRSGAILAAHSFYTWMDDRIATAQTKEARKIIKNLFKGFFTSDFYAKEGCTSYANELSAAAIVRPVLFIELFNHFSKKRSNYSDLTYLIQNWKEHPKYETIFKQEVITCLDKYYNTKQLSI